MGAETTGTGSGGKVCIGEGMVGGDRVEKRGKEGPLEVEDGSFVDCGEKAIVGVWWVGTPEGCVVFQSDMIYRGVSKWRR